MDGYYVNLNSCTVKIGLYNGENTPKFVSDELLPTVVSNSHIVDPQQFAKEFSRILAGHLGSTLPKLPIYYVLEPEVTELFLATSQKNGANEEEYISAQITERLVDEKVEDLYCHYFKIAPFVYQFAGIKKTYLEGLLEAGNALGLEIGGIYPLGLLLAKSNNDVSSMFVFTAGQLSTVVFSELTGVTFAEKFTTKVSVTELKDLFGKLSIYNSKHEKIQVYSTIEKVGGRPAEQGFESAEVAREVLTKQPTIAETQVNLLNILPVPQVAQSRKVPAIAMAGVVSVLLLGGIVLQLTVGFNNIFKNSGQATKQEVLADENKAVAEVTPTPTSSPVAAIKRTDIKIRVENGNGVPGSAGKLKTYMEGFGYNVAGVGNADKDNYANTSVFLPKELAAYKDLIKNDLKTNYSVEITETDKKSADYDVLIVAGLK